LPDRFAWVADRKRPGVETKHLGTFSEMRTGLGFFRLLPGARLPAGRQEDAEIRYLVEGEIQYGGRSWGAGTYFYLPPDAETEALASKSGGTFFTITLPMIAEMAARQRDRTQNAAAAAE
jgi:hypothetical protein